MIALWWRALAARWVSMAVIPATVGAFLLVGIPAVQAMGTDVYASMPEAMLALAGVPAGADVAMLTYNQMLGFIGAVTVAGFAVTMGAQSIAGEERDKTLPLLLSHPVSRVSLGVARAAGLATTVALTCLALWAVSVAAAVPFDLDVGDAHVGELCLALGANALLCGAVSFAVGAATGNRGLALGSGSAVLAVGWLLAGLLPLWPDARDAAELIPWYWYSKPKVLVNGIDTGYLTLLTGCAVGLLGVGVAAFPLRDLGRAGTRPRRRSRRSSSSRRATRNVGLSGLWVSRHVGLLVVVAAIMSGLMGLAMGPLYAEMAPDLEAASQAMPPELMRLWGAEDLSTPAGFFWGETMGIMAPAAVILVGAAVAAALGSDEGSGRLGWLLAAGLPRARALGTVIAIQVSLVAAVAVATGLGVWGGVTLASLDLPAERIAGATAHLVALGWFVGASAMLAVAATGRAAAATWTATGVGLIGYFVFVTLPMTDSPQWARLSPMYYYAAAHPLDSGANWGHVLILLGAATAMLAASWPLFSRRDLRV